MPQIPRTPADHEGRTKRSLASAARKGRRAVRSLARGTLLAAGIAATQMALPEMDSRFHVFDPTLVDRLQAPITRHHE
ncbi:MAG TPA: hypothetical protein VII43_05690 [Opitutaceae bacterium]